MTPEQMRQQAENEKANRKSLALKRYRELVKLHADGTLLDRAPVEQALDAAGVGWEQYTRDVNAAKEFSASIARLAKLSEIRSERQRLHAEIVERDKDQERQGIEHAAWRERAESRERVLVGQIQELTDLEEQLVRAADGDRRADFDRANLQVRQARQLESQAREVASAARLALTSARQRVEDDEIEARGFLMGEERAEMIAKHKRDLEDRSKEFAAAEKRLAAAEKSVAVAEAAVTTARAAILSN